MCVHHLLLFSLSWLLRASAFSVRCPDPNREHPRPVFAARPQQRSSAFRVRSRTSTAIICAQCSLRNLNRHHLKDAQRNSKKICRNECQQECLKIYQKNGRKNVRKICQRECQRECHEICQKECQKVCQKERHKDCREIC